MFLTRTKDIFETLKRDISIEGRACNFFIKEDEKENFDRMQHRVKEIFVY